MSKSGYKRRHKSLTNNQQRSMKRLIQALTEFISDSDHDTHDDATDNRRTSSSSSSTSSADEGNHRTVQAFEGNDWDSSTSQPMKIKRSTTALYEWEPRPETNIETLELQSQPPGPSTTLGGPISTCKSLINESIQLEYALRTLGSGGPGMYGSWILRKSLRGFVALLQDLSPNDLFKENRTSSYSLRYELSPFVDGLPACLWDLSKAFSQLEKSLLDYVALYHSVYLSHILHLLSDKLKEEAHYLRSLKQVFCISPMRGVELNEHLNEFFGWLDEHLSACLTELSGFRTKGSTMIKSAQESQTGRYLTLTTIATFFSAVTSATLQISFQESLAEHPLTVATNTFFFTSLIFSTASAVQSLLVMAWQRSFVRSPEHQLPMWAYSLLSKGPLLSLVIAGALFSGGICLFVFASQQSLVTSLFTVIFAFVHGAGLVALALWFVYEQWMFRKDAGPIGRKLTHASVSLACITIVIRILKTIYFTLHNWSIKVLRFGTGTVIAKTSEPRMTKCTQLVEEVEDAGIEIYIQPPSRAPSRQTSFASDLETDGDAAAPGSSNASVAAGIVRTAPLEEMVGDSDPRVVLDMGIVEEPDSILAEPGGQLAPVPGNSRSIFSALASNIAALAPQRTDRLQIRRATWEEELRQDSITYMEMQTRLGRRPRYPLPDDNSFL